jgi:hypothetical protein
MYNIFVLLITHINSGQKKAIQWHMVTWITSPLLSFEGEKHVTAKTPHLPSGMNSGKKIAAIS